MGEYQSSELNSLPYVDRIKAVADGSYSVWTEKDNHKIQSTDRIRKELIPAWIAARKDTISIIKGIHNEHARGHEHEVISKRLAAHLTTLGTPEIAGVFRGTCGLNIDLYMGGGAVQTAHYADVPSIMEHYGAVSDELFPYEQPSTLVNEETIYTYLSALQLALVMAHPTLDMNGRTSEDHMLALWARRPDLENTVRYISADGSRTGRVSHERGDILNEAAVKLRNTWIKDFMDPTLSDKYWDTLYSHTDVYNEFVLRNKHEQNAPRLFYELYKSAYTAGLYSFIQRIPDIEYLQSQPFILQLADNLKNASTTYSYAK